MHESELHAVKPRLKPQSLHPRILPRRRRFGNCGSFVFHVAEPASLAISIVQQCQTAGAEVAQQQVRRAACVCT